MRRVGPRGSGQFERISWDEALDLVAKELARVKAQHTNRAIFGGSYGWASAGRFHHAQSQVHRFLNSIGGYVRHQDSYSLGAARVLMPHIVATMEELMSMHTGWDVLAKDCKLFVTFGGVPRKNAQINAGGATLHHVKGGLYSMREAGVRFVTVNGWVGPAPGETGGGPPASSWDMHGGNMGMGNAFSNGSYGMNFCLPRLDESLSALLTDLKERGMLEDTMVVAVGEFGRTPVILTEGPPGRQHWPQCFSAIVAGCGIRGGAVYGESDKTGAAPKSNPVTPQDLHATILHALGVPLSDLGKNTGIIRPPFSSGKPVMGLFG